MGTGYGMIVDMAISSIIWTAIQLMLFQYPDLTPYKLKKFAKIDL